MRERIEFLLVWDDNTWDTMIFEIPEYLSIDDDPALEGWFNGPKGPLMWTCYRRVIRGIVWNTSPDLDGPYEKLE